MRGAPEWKQLESSLRTGVRRASIHLARAGLELVAAGGALLDEVIRVKRSPERGDTEGERGPTRIDVE